MTTIEILYGDYYLFGDEANVTYMRRCLPDARFILTSLWDEPYFAENTPDLIYVGAMSEENQVRVINALTPYRERLTQLIDAGVHMLFTANACDILGNYIQDGHQRTECLGIFDFMCRREMLKRFNGMTLGNYEGIEIVGYMSQFALAYTSDYFKEYFMSVTRGSGINPSVKKEGFKRNNLIATYLIGPFLIMNPAFTKRFLEEVSGGEVELPFEKTVFECYEKRLSEFKDPQRKIE